MKMPYVCVFSVRMYVTVLLITVRMIDGIIAKSTLLTGWV